MMTQEPTFGELRAAIATALQNARFRHSGPSAAQAETSLTRGQVVGLASQLPQPASRRFLDRVQVDLSADGQAALAPLLRQSRTLEPYFDEHKNYIHLDGGAFFSVSVAFSIARACARIVKGAMLHSVDDAARALARFLNAGTFPVRTVHLVKGPRVPSVIDLDTACQLVPYTAAVAMIGESLVDSPSNHRVPLGEDASGCGLVITTALCPGTDPALRMGVAAALRPEAAESRACLEYEGIAKFGPDFICAMLSLVTRRALYPFCHTQIVGDVYSDTLPMLPSRGGFSLTNVEFSVFPTRDMLTHEEIDRDELVCLVTAFAETSDDVRRHLMIPLARLRMAMMRREYVDRCIDLCVALEALVGAWGLKRFSERVAWVYSHVSDDVDGTKSTMKKFRSHRGRIVHAQPFKEQPELVEEAMSILIECIKWVVRSRRIPDWETEMV